MPASVGAAIAVPSSFDAVTAEGASLAVSFTPDAAGTSSPGEVTVVGEAASVTGVFVQTYNSAGTLTDRGFHLYVDC